MNTIVCNQATNNTSLSGMELQYKVATSYNSLQMEAMMANDDDPMQLSSSGDKLINAPDLQKNKEVEDSSSFLLKNDGGPPAVITITTPHSKRSKPRRQSGLQTANITEDTFKQQLEHGGGRPFLPRDDSLFLLKQRTTSAIPFVVPLVPADIDDAEEEEEEEEEEEDYLEPTTTPYVAHAKKKEQRPSPLSRIHRRKPRRLSGYAVQNETRPVLIRDDSLLLTKKKLAGMIPVTYEVPPSPTSDDDGVATKPVPTSIPLTRRQKQRGLVRQNSLGAKSA